MDGYEHADQPLGQNLDLTVNFDSAETPKNSLRRPFLGIHFRCCGVYARIYLNRNSTAYEGRCPKCLRPVRVGIAPHGTSARFFSAE